MVPNLWFEKDLKDRVLGIFKRRRLDLIPSICDSKDGFCLISISEDEIAKVLGSLNNVTINSTGLMTAKLQGTEICVDVVSVSII